MPKEKQTRRIAVMIGSKSDLPQCADGLLALQEANRDGQIELVFGDCIIIASIHRNLELVFKHLRVWASSNMCPDVLITGAGWANHLSGMCDAYLRYAISTTKIVVVGVAFEDPACEQHTMAARLSISEVPGTQVVFTDSDGPFISADGFLRACQFAISGELPEIKLPTPRLEELIKLVDAIDLVRHGQK